MPNPYDQYRVGGNYDDLDSLFGSSQPEPTRHPSAIAPLRVRKPKPVEPETPPAEEPGWFQKYGPTVVRGAGGLFGVTPWTGALGGGIGETVAEAIEQQDWTPELNPAKIAAETAIGAAGGGFAKLLGAGITSIPRALAAGAALGGAAPVIRHGLEQNDWDPRNYGKELAVGAGLGGATAGGLTALMRGLHPSAPKGTGATYDIESTAIPGGRVLGVGKQKTQYVNPIKPIHGEGLPPMEPVPSHGPQGPLTPRTPNEVSMDFENFDPNAPVDAPYVGSPASPTQSQAQLIAREAREAEAGAKAAEKARVNKEKLDRINDVIAGDELQRGEASVGESISATTPEGATRRLGYRFKAPEEAEEAGGALGQMLSGQADEPADLASEIARVKEQLAQTPAEAPSPDVPTTTVNPYEMLAQTLEGKDVPVPAQVAAQRMGPAEAPPVAPEAAPAPSPLEEVLTPKTPGKARVSRPRKGKTERFNEKAAAIAAQAGEPSVPNPMAAISEQARGQSLAELLGQVSPDNPGVTLQTPEGAVAAPVGADPAEALAALQGEAPLATPALPETGVPATLYPGSRTDVSGEHYRQLQDLFKKGEVPKEAARLAGAGLRSEAKAAGLPTGKAVNAPEPIAAVPEAVAAPAAPVEAPVASAPSWVEDENAIIDRLMQLPKEERLDAFVNGATASDPITPPAARAEAPAAPGPAAPPTAEQVSELQKLLLASGAIKDINEVPAWLKAQISHAPEAPPVAPPSPLKGKADIGGPRLNTKTGEGYAPQNYRPPYNPEKGGISNALAIRLGLGAAGAAVGGAADPLDDPLLSAMAGGAIGLSIPTIAQGLMKLGAAPEAVQNAMGDLNLPDGAKRAAEKIGRVLPQWQRANYLADVFGLGANAWAGPYGSGVFGALEKGLAGDPRGWAVLNELKNPMNFFKEYSSSYREARSLVGRAEGYSEEAAPTMFEKSLTVPGTILTAGDVAIRRILERHGFTDDEARIMTMTAEPFTKSGESFTHLRGLIPDLTFPFKRTPINIAEQGALRTPGLGFLMQGIGNARGTRAADSLGLQLAQQGMGLGIGLGSEQLGENLPPEDARVLRRFVTNAAGPYSLLAGMGMAAGQARRAGQPVAKTTIMRTADQLPLPSIEPIRDLALFLTGNGKEVPRGLYPAGVKANYDVARDYLTQKPQFPRHKKKR